MDNIAKGLYYMTYSLAHWIFAFYYYSCSKHLELTVNDEDPTKPQRRLNLIFLTFVVLNIVVPSVIGWEHFLPTFGNSEVLV